MRRLKGNQRHGCDYCRREGKKEPAVWTEAGETACDAHKKTLADRRRSDDHLTEADYQTWVRL